MPLSSDHIMGKEPPRESIVGQTLVGIAHSRNSDPAFVIEGIGPAQFRTHYLSLSNGLVLDLFTAELLVASLPADVMSGETSGLAPDGVIGRRVIFVARDDTYSTLVILEGGLFLKDKNDWCYNNPLFAGRLSEHYSSEQLVEFLDYWSEEPLKLNDKSFA